MEMDFNLRWRRPGVQFGKLELTCNLQTERVIVKQNWAPCRLTASWLAQAHRKGE